MAMSKQDISEIEAANPDPSLNSSENHEHKPVREALDDDPVYSYAEQRKIIHRLDRRLITIAGIIYMNSLMDRSNLPNAAIAGMLVDLDMVQGFRYVCDCDPRGFCCRC
jgi:hypothetical protein